MPKAESMCKMYLEPSDLSRDPHPCPRAPPRRKVRPFKSPLQPLAGGGGPEASTLSRNWNHRAPAPPPCTISPAAWKPWEQQGPLLCVCSLLGPPAWPGGICSENTQEQNCVGAWVPSNREPITGDRGSTRPEGKQPPTRGRARARCGTGASEEE